MDQALLRITRKVEDRLDETCRDKIAAFPPHSLSLVLQYQCVRRTERSTRVVKQWKLGSVMNVDGQSNSRSRARPALSIETSTGVFDTGYRTMTASSHHRVIVSSCYRAPLGAGAARTQLLRRGLCVSAVIDALDD